MNTINTFPSFEETVKETIVEMTALQSNVGTTKKGLKVVLKGSAEEKEITKSSAVMAEQEVNGNIYLVCRP